MGNDKLNILIVDDEDLFLESLSIILSTESDFFVSGTATDGAQALECMNKSEVDIVLLDLQMQGMDGLSFIPLAKKKKSDCKILVLTTFYDEMNIAEAIRLGADGYLLKDVGREVIISSIHQLSLGQGVIDNRVMAVLSQKLQNNPQPQANPAPVNLPELSARESEVCGLIADGYTNSQIASILYLSEGTVKNYVMTIYEKTGIRDRVKLALYYKNSSRKAP